LLHSVNDVSDNQRHKLTAVACTQKLMGGHPA